MASLETAHSLPKRNRIVGGQSKYGCFTCKSRRIKCDESKPQCRRCHRSNLRCEGYPLRAYSENNTPLLRDHSGSDSQGGHPNVTTKDPQPTYALANGFRRSPGQDRLARQGCSVLRDGLHDQFEATRAVFAFLLPQLSYSLPSVNAAAAALGAVYEMQTADPSTCDGKLWLVSTQYGAAVQEVQHELRTRPYGAVPILVACVLLACVDVLLRRPRIALLHLRGALRLLEERNATSAHASRSTPANSPCSTDDLSNSTTESLCLEEKEDDDITLLFRTLDVQTSLYANGLRPEMHVPLVRTPQGTATSPPCIHRTGRELMVLIQASYFFTTHALQYIYCPRVLVPNSLFIEQGRHIASLRQWLGRMNDDLLPCMDASPEAGTAASSKNAHCLILRNLCLAAIIYASKILEPCETGWDKYSSAFQEIVTGAELILDQRRRRPHGTLSSPRSTFTFTPSPGIIQPLYLTALKYKHPRWRRRALELLRESGKEGPWDGNLMASIAQRVIELEESELIGDKGSSTRSEQADAEREEAAEVVLADIVPEHLRISGCGPDYVKEAEGTLEWDWHKEWAYTSRWGWTGRRRVGQVAFSRCRNVHRMLAAGLDGPAIGEDAAWRDEQHWEMWTETVEY